jgi:hypothetical protein
MRRASGLWGALAVSLVMLWAQRSDAKCDPTGADAADVAAARAAVAANCECAGAANHGAFVRCASDQAKATLANKSCRGFVTKCAAKSTCGKPGFVTCCRISRKGKVKCSTKSSADKCKAPKGGQACIGAAASCCDSCGAGSPDGGFVCGSTTTTTAPPTTTTTAPPTTTTTTTSTTTTTMGSPSAAFLDDAASLLD